MGFPMTTGSLKTSIADMKVGDYIACKYVASSGAVGTFSEFGTSTATEIAVTGASAPNGTFYFVMVEKSKNGGFLCSDRVVQVSLSWDTMNEGKVIQGKPQVFDGKSGVIRSLTGGVAYATSTGGSSATDLGYGAFPTNNEWDRYIVNFPTDKIQAGKTLDDVFHWNGVFTLTQDTPVVSINASNSRTQRGNAKVNDRYSTSSSISSSDRGFRPVFDYREE